jgi:UDP-N-acetylglucosamine 1-carboxyvinyltransferase
VGVERLSGGEYTIAPDHIEVASFIGLAAATGGELMVEGGDRCRPRQLARGTGGLDRPS